MATFTAIQQDDNYKDFMTNITDGGLVYAVSKHLKLRECESQHHTQVAPENRKHVIIVGAGACGLTTAYELAQIGHKVTILEEEDRVGGRINTFRFDNGLISEAGAMRIPHIHYLTRHYIDLFKIPTVPFKNYNACAYLYMYGEKITMKEWKDNNGYYSDKWWPGWDQNLTLKLKKNLQIEGILDLYARTVEPLKTELIADHSERGWQNWNDKWNELSLTDFLRGDKYQSENGNKLRPWPEAAIEAYMVSTRNPQTVISLATLMRMELGELLRDPMYCIADGMNTLPKAFLKKNTNGWNQDVDLSKHIKYGIQVKNVYETLISTGKSITVEGANVLTGMIEEYKGDAVVLTVPLSILRKIDVPLSTDQRKSMTEFDNAVNTKIFLQCKTRFWQKEVGRGGFTKTNLQIEMINYPDYDEDETNTGKSGILMVYTSGENARAFGSMDPQSAIANAVEQISQIHPEIVDHFEVGRVKVWSCASSFLKPFEYRSNLETLTTTSHTDKIFLAGDALSLSTYWIQGAIYSGLMQSFALQYHLQTDVEHKRSLSTRNIDTKNTMQHSEVMRPSFHPTRFLLSEK